MAEVKEIGFAHSTNGGWMHIVRYMGKVQMKGTRYGVMEILRNGKGYIWCDENTSDRSRIWNYEKTINVKRVGDPISCDENTSVKVKKAAPPVCYYGEKFPLHWFSMACAMQHENNH